MQHKTYESAIPDVARPSIYYAFYDFGYSSGGNGIEIISAQAVSYVALRLLPDRTARYSERCYALPCFGNDVLFAANRGFFEPPDGTPTGSFVEELPCSRRILRFVDSRGCSCKHVASHRVRGVDKDTPDVGVPDASAVPGPVDTAVH